MTTRRAIKKTLRRKFPGLKGARLRITSKRTRRYNCIAWAAGENVRWWDPAPGYYWPKGVPRTDSIEAAIMVYESLGYEVCDVGDRTPGFDRVAIYGKAGLYEHAARLGDDGANWTSKLGRGHDIDHGTLESLVCDGYGDVVKVLRRKKQDYGQAL